MYQFFEASNLLVKVKKVALMVLKVMSLWAQEKLHDLLKVTVLKVRLDRRPDITSVRNDAEFVISC